MLEEGFMDGLLKCERMLLEGKKEAFIVCFKEFEVGYGWGLEGWFSKKCSYVGVVTELLLKFGVVREIGGILEDVFESGICVSEMFAEGSVDCDREEACDW